MNAPQSFAELRPRPIREWRNVTVEVFRERIAPSGQPAVLRGLVDYWPIVAAARESDAAAAACLSSFDTGRKVPAVMGPPEIGGRFFYNAALNGFNFLPGTATVGHALDFLARQAKEARPASLALQSIPVRENLPAFETQHPLEILDGVAPRLWLGNAVTVAAHQDHSDNVACVAIGRRRFTLFPPEQVANLYVGPFELTPAGVPVSLVDFDAPDLQRHPRFAEALVAAQGAELEPGDAIFIPYLWWHHVRSLGPLNLLVNYWWAPHRPGHGAPREAMIHAMLAVGSLPEPQRSAWRAMFDHYVFGRDGSPGAHLPPEGRGVLGELEPRALREVRRILIEALQKA